MNTLWLKAAHVGAALTWVAGLLLLSIASRGPSASEPSPEWRRFVLTWSRWVTTPAMLAVWGLGLTMAARAHWFSSGWLMAKLACVLALSAGHGYLSGRLRRRASPRRSTDSKHDPDRSLTAVSIAIILLSFAIAALVVVKPF